MAITNTTQTFDDTAAVIGTPRGGRRFLAVRNPSGSGATLYIGGPDVDVDNATWVLPEGAPTLVLTSDVQDSLAGEAWHGVCDASEEAEGVAVTEA